MLKTVKDHFTKLYGDKAFEQMMDARLFFVFCILEAEAASARATIKWWGDVENGMLL